MASTSAVAVAAKWIGSTLVNEAEYLYGVEDHVRSLQRELECMQTLLQQVDSNPSLVRQDNQLRIFAQQIQELAFRAEDAIDTYVVDVGSKVYKRNFFLKLVCLASHSYPVHMLRKEIEAIQQEIEEAKNRCEGYRKMVLMPNNNQQGNDIGSSSSRTITENYLHLSDEVVVGIEDDIIKLVKRLTDPEEDFRVLAIVGTGGAGKTTLASQVYRHSKVKSRFPHKAFVCVSQQWSRFDLICRIFKQIKGDQVNIPSNESELVKDLHDFMKDKQCLVVLDDIWKKDAWDDIYPIFPPTRDIRVILTTRIEEVPLHTDKKCVLHEPQLLTEEQKWELFSKGAVEGRQGIENDVEFEKLGKQMLKKCEGLPLAVVTLAGILRTKQQLCEWEGISRACNDYILKGKGGRGYGVVEDMLELSYLDLPTHLKPCFLYLAIIPEDKEFSSEQLAQMWIAEGFITNDQKMRGETLEDAAMRLLNELAQRYILQVIERNLRGQIERFRLHDLMREFCIKKATEYHFIELLSDESRASQARRISVFSREYCPPENHHLRTLVYFGGGYRRDDGGGIRKLDSFHKEFKLLRVLSISYCTNDALPKQIGNLIHLTYLSLVDTLILELPKSISNLRNLMYLIYRSNFEVEVPSDLVRNMENLRVLVLPYRLNRDSNICNGLALRNTKKLHTLRCGAGKWMTKDLPTVSPTVTNLEIYYVSEIEEMEAIHRCFSILKDSLCTFKCKVSNEMQWDLKLDLEILSDCETLWSLDLDFGVVRNNCAIRFPPNLVSLTLEKSNIEKGVDLMEVLGQLSKLKYLCLSHNSYDGGQLTCVGTSFPQLQEIRLEGMYYVSEWRVEGRAMERLKRIRIRDCAAMKTPELVRWATPPIMY